MNDDIREWMEDYGLTEFNDFARWCYHYHYDPHSEAARWDYREYVEQRDLLNGLVDPKSETSTGSSA